MRPGWEYTIWSIAVIDPGLVSEGFLIDLPERLTLVLHGLLWDLPNSQETQGGSFLTFLSLLGIIPLLDNLRRYLKEQWFSLCCQTRIYLYSCPKMPLVDHILAMSYLMISYPTVSFTTSSKLVGIWDGFLVEFRRSSPASRISSWHKYSFYRCLPRETPWCAPLGWKIYVDLTLSSISQCILGIGAPCNSPLWARKVLIGPQNRVPRLITW